MKRILMIAGLLLTATSVVGQVGISDPVTQPKQSGSWRWPIYKVERERVSVALPAPPAMSKTKKFSPRLKKERLEQTLQASANGVFFKVYIFENSKSYRDGRVVNIRVVRALPFGMTEAAIEASRKIKFDPALKDGKSFRCGCSLNIDSLFDH